MRALRRNMHVLHILPLLLLLLRPGMHAMQLRPALPRPAAGAMPRCRA
jgi:hypothetical protein